MLCESETMRWHMMSRQAAWIPPGLMHSARAMAPLTATLLKIDVRRLSAWPDKVVVTNASQLLASLIERLHERSGQGWAAPVERLIAVLADEFASLAPVPQQVPLPRDIRLREFAADMLADLQASWELGNIAVRYGYSRSTLSRAFAHDTGMSLGRWLLCARMNSARLLIEEGGSVSETAERIGYGTVSGFCAAFRQHFGASPTRLGRKR